MVTISIAYIIIFIYNIIKRFDLTNAQKLAYFCAISTLCVALFILVQPWVLATLCLLNNGTRTLLFDIGFITVIILYIILCYYILFAWPRGATTVGSANVKKAKK